MDLRLLIIADDLLARAGLAALLANEPDCTVVGQVASDVDLLAKVDIYQPDILLWDLGWNPALVLDQLANLADIEVPAVVLVPDLLYAITAWVTGVYGLLPRNIDTEKLVATLRAVHQGLITLDPEVARALLPNIQTDLAPLVETLTARELEVLQHLARGLTNKAIARQLDISEHTVKFHVNAIMGKLGAQSRTEAVVRATQLGLIFL